MRVSRIGWVAALATLTITVFAGTASADGHTPNQEGYWEDQLARQGVTADCFKHDRWDQTPHGVVSADGLSVMLNPFDPSWEQDHYVLLVVNGGSNDGRYPNPVAGAAYFAPLNGGGQTPVISHWTICKGDEDEEEVVESTVATVPPTTAAVVTTVVEASSTTVATATTATATTLAPAAPGQPAASTTAAEIVQQSTAQLPETGAGIVGAIIAGLFALFSGIGIAIWRRATAVN